MIDNLKVKGDLEIVVRDKDGKVKDNRQVNNLVVNTGLNYIASRIISNVENVMSHMAIGTGTTAPNASDTALVSIAGARETIDSLSITDNAIKYTAIFEAGNQSGDITEAGIFNALTGGSMLCRTTFSAVTKESNDTLTIAWTITVSA